MNIKPARPEDIPKATHEGVMELLGMKLRTYRLDDGRTVIHADDFHAFLKHAGFEDVLGADGENVTEKRDE